MSIRSDTESNPSFLWHDAPEVGQVVATRFVLRKKISEAVGSRTFFATDKRSGELYVVKALAVRALSQASMMRLEYEAALLSRVRSRWFAPLVHFDQGENTILIVLKHIDGVSLSSRLAAGTLSLNEAIVVGRAIFSALRDIHCYGALHRAVRPSNVIVNEYGAITIATLVDFGPSRCIQAEERQQRQSVEIARYVSPEQAGSIDQDVTEASDLYSAGLVLFHCLTGHVPFHGDTVGTVLFEHMTVPVPELRRQGIAVPGAVDELVKRLVRKDPRDRYQSAEATLADLEEIDGRLARGEADPSVVIGGRDRRYTLTEPAFVARTQELSELVTQIRRTREGNGGVSLLEGESGGGKTRLLAETAYRAACEGLWVLRGQATNEVAWQPLKVLDGIVEGFITAWRSRPELAEDVRQRLGDYVGAVVSALPGLAEALGGDAARVDAPEATAEARTVRAVAQFLEALAVPDRPVLIILDDCQWGGELSDMLIRYCQTSAQAASGKARHWMLIAAFRSEEVGENHLLRRIEASKHVRLTPLDEREIRALVESMAGPLPDDAVDLITRLAGGSPFMASAVLRGLVETDALIGGSEGWQVDSLALADVSSSNRAAAFLARRLELLPAKTARLLTTGAVLGKEFTLEMTFQLVQQEASQAIAALDEARQRRLVWLRPNGASCVFVHDKIRSALLDRITPKQRQEIHLQAANYLRENFPERVSDLAYHFDAAGDSQAALPFALQAAEQARSQHVLEIAEQQYRIAQRGMTSADGPTRFRIVEGLGDVLMLRGHTTCRQGISSNRRLRWLRGPTTKPIFAVS